MRFPPRTRRRRRSIASPIPWIPSLMPPRLKELSLAGRVRFGATDDDDDNDERDAALDGIFSSEAEEEEVFDIVDLLEREVEPGFAVVALLYVVVTAKKCVKEQAAILHTGMNQHFRGVVVYVSIWS